MKNLLGFDEITRVGAKSFNNYIGTFIEHIYNLSLNLK